MSTNSAVGMKPDSTRVSMRLRTREPGWACSVAASRCAAVPSSMKAQAVCKATGGAMRSVTMALTFHRWPVNDTMPMPATRAAAVRASVSRRGCGMAAMAPAKATSAMAL